MEYIDTRATPFEIQKYLSLCGPSIETVTKAGDDYVYDIEITSNRVDMASVYGIAREATAILNRFGIKTTLKPLKLATDLNHQENFPLEIADKSHLCKRILAIVIDGITIKPSPPLIQKRLENVGIRSLNNVVDITNYIMTEVGHPAHVFDYDRIKTHKLILRTATDREEIITLDEKKYNLNIQDIIIDDGTGQVIDLPGIMGTANSVVTPQTKRVLFFIESNDPVSIRRSSMRYGIRTVAATINEKGPSPQTAKIAFLRGIELFKEITSAKIASREIDIYEKPPAEKKITLSYSFLDKILGIHLEKSQVNKILTDLEFEVKELGKDEFQVTIPHFRANDINIKEDIVEEVARIYGYGNLPSVLPPPAYVAQPKETEKIFDYQTKIKYFLKHLGLTEVMNYSMVSKQQIEDFDLKPGDHLRLTNSISQDIEYLRTHLTSSLVKDIKENEGKKEVLKIFEIAKTYKPRPNDLPLERLKLGIAVNTDLFDLKGICEALIGELNIENCEIKKITNHAFAEPGTSGQFVSESAEFGVFGQLKEIYKTRAGLKSQVFLAVFDFENLIDRAKNLPSYHKINPFAVVKLDLTLADPKKSFQEIKETSFKASKYLQKVEFVSLFKNKLTIRFYFNSPDKNLTEEEGKSEFQKINEKIS